MVRAYSEAVRQGVEAAGTLRREEWLRVSVRLDHAAAAKAESEFRRSGFTILDARYGSDVELKLGVPEPRLAALQGQVGELSGGKSEFETAGTLWVDANQTD